MEFNLPSVLSVATSHRVMSETQSGSAGPALRITCSCSGESDGLSVNH
jgi:hypothetical protein